MLYIGSDHGGYELKEDLKAFLDNKGVKYVDVGPKKLDPADDYPKFSAEVARKVAEKPEEHQGLLMCRSGQGVCIAANKIKGARAATAWNEKVAQASRQDDNANILCLPSDYISAETAESILGAWLNAKFTGEERHRRRLSEIESLENHA
jgi:ribose 5-phosphate isomerase B